MRRVGVCVLAVTAFAASAYACGSVPEVTFADDGGSQPDGNGSGDVGVPDARADSATDAAKVDASDAGKDSGSSCPGTAPSGGICCGTFECIGCNAGDCASCTMKACSGSNVCCPTGGPGNVTCKRKEDC